jgi:hypothetical protein
MQNEENIGRIALISKDIKKIVLYSYISEKDEPIGDDLLMKHYSIMIKKFRN